MASLVRVAQCLHARRDAQWFRMASTRANARHSTSSAALSRDSRAERVLRDIRRLQFGEPGDALDERALYNRRERAKACKLLSEELYSKEVHFLLELIQNADDNSYAQGVVPSLSLTVTQGGITVLNNEVGFTEDNVRAICSIGSSTKTKAAGFVGEKGIGFKSVFTVADHVYIYSSGFCFMFDTTTELGYIEPVTQDPADFPVPLTRTAGTTMYLKFKPGLDKGKLFEDMQAHEPEALLFLNQLRHLRMELPSGLYEIQLQPGSKPRVEQLVCTRSTSRTTKHFLKVSKQVTVPESAQDAKRRAGVTSTTLTIAFPLTGTLDAPDLSSRPYCFAFLPTFPSGLKFIVQADFIVTASRETILSDKAWNQHLREELLHVLLKDALPTLKLLLPTSYLAFLPLPGEAHSFFGSYAGSITRCLNAEPCVYTMSGHWQPAGDTRQGSRVWRNQNGSNVFSDSMLSRLGELHYPAPVHPADLQLQRRVDEVMQMLGGRMLDEDDVVRCLTHSAAKAVLRQQPDEWFIQLYRCLSNVNASSWFWRRLCSEAPIFRLEEFADVHAAAGRKLFLWDHKFDDSCKAMFQPHLQLLDHDTWDESSVSILQSRFDITQVTYASLLQILLGLYSSSAYRKPTPADNVRHLHFMRSIFQLLSKHDQSSVRSARVVRSASGSYASAQQLFFPDVPADVRPILDDLLASGVTLADSDYARGGAHLQRFLVDELYMKQLTPVTVAQQLVAIHQAGSVSSEDKTKLHVTYLLKHQADIHGLGRGMRLPGDDGVMHAAGDLYLPLPPDLKGFQRDMHTANMTFVKAQVLPSGYSHEEVADVLGIKQPDIKDVLRHLGNLFKQSGPAGLTGSHSSADVLRLLQFLYKHWDDVQAVPGLASSLRKHVVLCVASAEPGRVEYAASSKMYLPLPGDPPACLLRVAQLAGVQLVHPDYDRLAPEPPTSATLTAILARTRQVEDSHRFLIDCLGVTQLSEALVIKQYLCMCRDERSKVEQSLSDEDLLGLLRLLAAQCSGSDASADELGRLASQHVLLRVVTAGGEAAAGRRYVTPCSTAPLYMPAQGDGWKLKDVLGADSKVLYLHDAWAANSSSKTDSSWTQFLTSQLGLQDRVSPVPGSSPGTWCLPDELQSVVTAQQEASAAAAKTLAIMCMLRDTWRAAGWAAAAKQGGEDMLAQLGSMQVPLEAQWEGNKQDRLDRTYLRTDVLENCFGAHVPYVMCPDPNEKHWAFLAKLGVACKLQPHAVLQFLRHMSQSQEPLSASQYQLYQSLCDADAQQLKEAFATEPLIYLPEPKSTGGQWVCSAGKLRWCAGPHGAELPLGGFTCLERIYGGSGTQHFFQDVLGIPDASDQDLGQVLISLTRRQDLPGDKLSMVATHLYSSLAGVLHKSGEVPKWLTQLMSQPVLLLTTGKFVSSDQASVYLPDDPLLSKVFSGMPGVQLLAVDSRVCPTLEPLLWLCPQPVLRLSRAVQKLPPLCQQAVFSPELSQLMHAAFPYAASIAQAADPHCVQAAINSGRAAALGSTAGMCVYTAQELTTSYQLGELKTAPQAVSSVTHVPTGGAGQQSVQLYVDLAKCDVHDGLEDQEWDMVLDQLAMRYAELWGAPTAAGDITMVLEMLHKGMKPDRIGKRLQHKGILLLPDALLRQLRQAGLAVWDVAEPGAQSSDVQEADLALLAASLHELDTSRVCTTTNAHHVLAPIGPVNDSDEDTDASSCTPPRTRPAPGMPALALVAPSASTRPDQAPGSQPGQYHFSRIRQSTYRYSESRSCSYESAAGAPDMHLHQDAVMSSELPSLESVRGLSAHTDEWTTAAHVLESEWLVTPAQEPAPARTPSDALPRPDSQLPPRTSTRAAALHHQRTITVTGTESISLTVPASQPASVGSPTPWNVQVGALGELYVWRWLANSLPPDQFCWVSSARQMIDQPAPYVEPPFDFWVDDAQGKVFGQPNTLVLLEVKSSSSQGSRSFFMSNREWDLAMELSRRACTAADCFQGASKAAGLPPAHLMDRALVYVVMVVGGVPRPQVERVLVDPGLMYQQGRLSLSSTEKFMVRF